MKILNIVTDIIIHRDREYLRVSRPEKIEWFVKTTTGTFIEMGKCDSRKLERVFQEWI